MAYTPINWQTGDTITAEKMNKMDNGWGVESTQLFSETATTETLESGFNAGSLYYRSVGIIDADIIIVTFDGVDYTCNRIDIYNEHFYGGFTPQGPAFTEYPFALESAAGICTLYTQTAGTYTIAVQTPQLQTSTDFSTAVNSCVNAPMLCVSGVTNEDEMETAQQGEKLLYFKYNNATYIITAVEYGSISFMPNDSSIVPNFVDGIFDIEEV